MLKKSPNIHFDSAAPQSSRCDMDKTPEFRGNGKENRGKGRDISPKPEDIGNETTEWDLGFGHQEDGIGLENLVLLSK
jgi:hypothetical protein